MPSFNFIGCDVMIIQFRKPIEPLLLPMPSEIRHSLCSIIGLNCQLSMGLIDEIGGITSTTGGTALRRYNRVA